MSPDLWPKVTYPSLKLVLMTQSVSYLKQQCYLTSVGSVLCRERKEERVSEKALVLRGHGPMDEPDFGRLPSRVWGEAGERENRSPGAASPGQVALELGALKAAWGLILN